jgi:amino acid adenylation domain-containing protein
VSDADLERELPIRPGHESPSADAKRARLKKMLVTRGRSTVEIHPLSYQQNAIWFLQARAPESYAYNVAYAARILSRLDVERLTSSLQALSNRHPLLRVTFHWRDGSCVQEISGYCDVELDEIDARRESERGLHERIQRSIELPFDLAGKPPVRLKLFKRAEDDHVFLIVLHHIACDFASLVILVSELERLYSAAIENRPFPLRPLKGKYAAFVRDQRALLAGHHGQALWKYWKSRLDGELPVLNLPTDNARPMVETYVGASSEMVFPQGMVRRCMEVALAEGVTPFTLLLAVFQVLLHRYSAQHDVLVGIPTAGRDQPEYHGVVGCFINFLPVRADLGGNPVFRDVLQHARDAVLGVLAHQEYPFSLLVDRLGVPRDSSLAPVCQVAFNYQSVRGLESSYRTVLTENGSRRIEFAGMAMEPFDIEQQVGQFDLMLDLIEGGGSIRAAVKFKPSLFEKDTIGRLIGHYQTLLGSVLDDVGQHIGDLKMLATEEFQQIVEGWNRTSTDLGRTAIVHELVEKQVARSPDRVACNFEGEKLTYRELDDRANRLAEYLTHMGAGPNVVVGVLLERSLDLAVALLGILKSGAAYLPIDPDLPAERIAFMLRDASAKAVVTTDHLERNLPWDFPIARVRLHDRGREPWLEVGATNGARGVAVAASQPEHLAYVMYTSGSTGRPKGVLVSHGAIANRLLWMQHRFGIGTGDAVLQQTTYSFDHSIWEVFWPLLSGARLVLARPGGQRDTNYIADAIDRHSITHVFFVPSMLEIFLETGRLDRCRGLKDVFCGGEALSGELARKCLARLNVNLHNLYGPTEASIDATAWTCHPGELGDSIPIGRPIANCRVYILDQYLNPVPIGVSGELHIAGRGLARGYLNRPEVTAEKFIPDPFDGSHAGRMYRTGDLARYRRDGAIEFLGRLDHQVKLRGHRIEPGEIEALLCQQPGVRQALVMMSGTTASDRKLVAYVAGDFDGDTSERLRLELGRALPDYMVPEEIVPLTAFPLLANGKVDRRALPEPVRRRGTRGRIRLSVAQERVAAVWCAVLGVENIGLADNFFELGGNSLKALDASFRIAETLGRDVPVTALLQHPKLAEYASAVDGLATSASRCPPVEMFSLSEGEKGVGADENLALVEIRSQRLVRHGKLDGVAEVDSAAIAYLTPEMLLAGRVEREALREQWCGDGPVIAAILQTHRGRIALILIPFFTDELYRERERLVESVRDAVAVAERAGARAVSLTGLIPSATDYGQAVQQALPSSLRCRVTTGHPTTAATVVLTTERVLYAAGRSMQDERLGMVGLGSIGLATLRLVLDTLPHPAELVLCDVYRKRALLDGLAEEVRAAANFHGPITIVTAQEGLPQAVYRSSFLIGATNAPCVLDVGRLAPGTIIVDDSAPHCFRVDEAHARLRASGDILFCEGGVLRSPIPIAATFFVPDGATSFVNERDLVAALGFGPLEITGCIFSSLLSASFATLPPAVGLTCLEDSKTHYRVLREMGFAGEALHCDGSMIPEKAVGAFREQFGSASKGGR